MAGYGVVEKNLNGWMNREKHNTCGRCGDTIQVGKVLCEDCVIEMHNAGFIDIGGK
jgi:NMD protein affecting ribosome stability and mRNA decay